MVVTLCGSSRFEKDFKEAKFELGLRGHVVIDMSTYPSERPAVSEPGEDLDSSHNKIILDLVHLQKIMVSGAILIVGNGYIGKSTAREILWALMLEKVIVEQKDNSWDNIDIILRRQYHDSSSIVGRARQVLYDNQ